MKRTPLAVSLLAMLFIWAAMETDAAPRRVTMEALPEYASYRPGSPLRVAFVLQIQNDWHTFWTNPVAPQGAPVSVEWKLPEGWRAEGLQFPAPKRVGGPGLVEFGYTGEEVVLDTLVPPVEESAGEVTIQAKLTWRVAQNEVVSEESRCTLSFQRAGKSQVRPLRADRFRIWQGRIPRPDREFHPALEKKFLAKSYILTFPGTKGQARPEYFPSASQGLDLSTPLKAKYEEGAWNIEIRFNSADTKRPKVLEGVLEPGPSGGSPVWISVRVP